MSDTARRTMRITTFWKLIEQSRAAATAAKDQAATLVDMLAELPVKGVIAFARLLNACNGALWYSQVDICCYLLSGGYASEDGQKDFRSDLVSRGRIVFESALRDPDSLADLIPPEEYPFYEVFAYSADYAYNRKTGSWFEDDGINVYNLRRDFGVRALTRLDGELIELGDAPTYLPRLYQRFLAGMRRSLAEAKEQFASPDPRERCRSLSTFDHFAFHSKEAVDVLHGATRDADNEVREEANRYLERLLRVHERK